MGNLENAKDLGQSIYTKAEVNVDFAHKVSSIAGLASLGSSTPTVIVTDTDRGGIFVWSASGTANGGTVFAGSSGYWVRQYEGAVNVKWFGAVGDGVTDDTAAIQAAIDAALAAGQTITAEGTFKITNKIVIKGDTNFLSVIFNVYSTPSVAVEISTGSATDPTDSLVNITVFMPQVINMTKPSTGWVGQGVGVRTVNLDSCRIFFNKIYGFSTGLLVTSFTAGNAYNEYHIGNLDNNKVNLALTPGNSGAWTNENNFYGGRYSYLSGEGSNVPNVRQILISKASNSVNNNLFIKPSLEGNAPEYHVENGGQYNTIIQGRWEAVSPKVLYTADSSNQATYNVISGGYNSSSITYTYSGTASSFSNQSFFQTSRNVLSGVAASTDGGALFNFRNTYSASGPAYKIFAPSTQPETATSTGWNVSHSSQSLQGKRTTDTSYRANLDYVSGYINLGDGAGNNTFWRYYTLNQMRTNAALIPDTDAAYNIGSGTLRWGTLYAATGTINTSDAREKAFSDIPEVEMQVAKELKSLVRRFKFNDAIEAKGEDKARIHYGTSAQEVIAVFAKYNLDAFKYGMVCYDEWEEELEVKDEEGNVTQEYRPAGNRYGIRYEELIMFILGAL